MEESNMQCGLCANYINGECEALKEKIKYDCFAFMDRKRKLRNLIIRYRNQCCVGAYSQFGENRAEYRKMIKVEIQQLTPADDIKIQNHLKEIEILLNENRFTKDIEVVIETYLDSLISLYRSLSH